MAESDTKRVGVFGPEKVPDDFRVLLKEFEGLIRYAAYINSEEDIPGLEFDDLAQEGRRLLHEYWDWAPYRRLPMNEFNVIFKVSLFREMKGIRRERFRERCNNKAEAFSIDAATEAQHARLVISDRPEEAAEVGELIAYLQKNLSKEDFEILQEMVYPSNRMIEILNADDKEKYRRTYDVAVHQLARFFRISQRRVLDARFRIQETTKDFLRKNRP